MGILPGHKAKAYNVGKKEQETGDMYTLEELIQDMPLSIAELTRRSGVDERTLLRMRKGQRVQRANAVKVLNVLAEIYGKEINLRNVSGINLYN